MNPWLALGGIGALLALASSGSSSAGNTDDAGGGTLGVPGAAPGMSPEYDQNGRYLGPPLDTTVQVSDPGPLPEDM